LREKSEQQRGHIFRGKWEQFPRKIFCDFWPNFFFCCGRPHCTDPYSLYDSVEPYGFGMEIEVIFGTIFEAIFRFSMAVCGSYGTVRTVDCGHEKRGTEEAGQWYDFGTENETDLCGTDLVL
jgi:hypothetical protein